MLEASSNIASRIKSKLTNTSPPNERPKPRIVDCDSTRSCHPARTNQEFESSAIPAKKPPRRWKKEDILREIREWYAKWGSFQQMGKRNKELVSVARLHFGSWKLAIEAASFHCSRRKWTRENILDEIKQLRNAGESLSSCEHSKNNLIAAARRCFGSWYAALHAAGVTSKQRKQRKPR